jgi:hypothetical protein
MLLHGLSQDDNLIELCSILWRDGYYDKIPSPQFYKLLLDVVPFKKDYVPWIKKTGFNVRLIKAVCEWFRISTREAQDYLNILYKTDEGIEELGWILQGVGFTEKEAEEIIVGDKDDE